MSNPKAAKYNGLDNGDAATLTKVEGGLTSFNNALNPFSGQNRGQTPWYSTGARALLRIGGKSLAVATSISWNISYNIEPVNTIDTPFAWDFDVAQMTFNASINQIIDPTGGPEVNSLFSTMASAVHQPLVEVQIIDAKTGTSILFAKGMFNSISANMQKGQIASWSANMRGSAYQHYVAQDFSQPYGVVADFGNVLSAGLSSLSSITGGIL